MPFILVRHTVADFATWKPSYDEHATIRKDAGSMGGRVLRSADNLQDVVVLQEWDNPPECAGIRWVERLESGHGKSRCRGTA